VVRQSKNKVLFEVLPSSVEKALTTIVVLAIVKIFAIFFVQVPTAVAGLKPSAFR
jgi:hypothetical protein